MKAKVKMLFLSLAVVGGLLSAISPVCSAQNIATSAKKVEVWKRTDILLSSGKSYTNPYLDVQIDAVFTHSDGTQIKLFGFWNGGNEWRIRFSPTKTGVWNYTVTCTDNDNKDLNNVSGRIVAVENTGKTELDRHGFIKISDNGRYFTYDDGTPFYWLGDTNWQAPNYVSLTDCNYPGCSCKNQFKHEVDDRLDKGFTVYQTYFDSAENDGGGQIETSAEPGLWKEKFTLPDADTFNNKIDKMFDYLADSGMVIALGYGVHSQTFNGMSEQDMLAFSRYLTARYAAYPVAWITAQEINGEPQYNYWKKSAEVVNAGDGYNHPQSAHMFTNESGASKFNDLDSQPWHEWWAVQGGHGGAIRNKDYYKLYWDNGTKTGNVKPFLETEANYEDISCGGFNGYDASRISAWKANLSGSYGFTYGATGIWANNYSTAGNTGWFGSFSFEPWYMGLDKPGSFEMTYLKKFFEYADFSTLVPRFNDDYYSDFTDENKLVSSSDDGNTYVAYFYNGSLDTGELRGLSGTRSYSARWYNPLTGRFIDISDKITLSRGVYKIPQKPTAGDWALLVTSRDLGPYETETPYSDSLIDNRENLALGAAAKCSSNNGEAYSAGKATDGDKSTYWCAAGGGMPQWLQIDMGSAAAFEEIQILMHPGNDTSTKTLSYTLYGSSDSVTWDEVYSAADAPPIHKGKYDLLKIKKSGNYRFLKIEFSDIQTNWAAVYEFCVFSAASENDDGTPDEDGILPKYNGVVQTPAASCSGSGIYTAEGIYSNSAANLFDGSLSTEWTPFSPISSQTVIMDLLEPNTLYGIAVTLGENAVAPPYRIEASNDKESWTILADATLRAQQLYNQGGKTVVCEALSGKYRYVKLLWLGAGSNSAIKTISEIKLYAENETPQHPALPDVSELQSVYYAWKNVNNSRELYETENWTRLQNSLSAAGYLLANLTDKTVGDVSAALESLKTAVALLDSGEIKKGDIDSDGKVTVSDVVALRMAIMNGTADDKQLAAGDFDDSGSLTVSDVVELRKMIMLGE
ncbi:MAG: DUF4038 domain-containing protein [Candidatus Howiella sp.]